jgi:hypothetical protein
MLLPRIKDITLASVVIILFSLLSNAWAQSADEYFNKGVDLLDQGRYDEPRKI